MNPSNTLRQPSRSAGLAIFYITVGVLATIWSAVWFFFLQRRQEPPAEWTYYVCAGLFFSGLALTVIGVLVGRIGRQARKGDTPVGEVTAATMAPAGTTPAVPAAPGAAVTPGASAAPVVAPRTVPVQQVAKP